MSAPFITRRRFLEAASLAALAGLTSSAWAKFAPASPGRHLITPDRKLRLAAIGIGGRGTPDLLACASEEIVALCDVDFDRGRAMFTEFPQAARYRDYRQMLDEMGDGIDAVIVATPDHTHFPAAMMAISRGKHVYVEKPLAHTIVEARQLKHAASKAGIVTQMGNHGHANEGTRLTKEWIDAGVIGPVREVHTWTNRPIWPQGLPMPAPEGAPPPSLDWNLWQGVAPARGYSSKIAPFNWRAFWNYGCGALGDMGCHGMDAPFWALDLRGPVRVSAESGGGSAEVAPAWSIITYQFPARGARPPLKYVWYDGGKRPPVPDELGPGGKLPENGSLYRGDRGVLMAMDAYNASVRLIPESRMREFTQRPPKTIPRVPKGSAHLEWINACKGGPAPGSNFTDHAADLTEFVLLGNVALRAGRPIDWDSAQCRCTGLPDADRFLSKTYRLF